VVKAAWEILSEVDVVLVIVDGMKTVTSEYLNLLVRLKNFKQDNKNVPFICVFNKFDIAKEKDAHLRKFNKVKETVTGITDLWNMTFTISSLKNEGVDDVRAFLMLNAKPQEWEYPAKVKTDQVPTQQVNDIIREKIMNYVYYEVPYMAQIVNGGWQEVDNAVHILTYIIVEKEGQRAIILGKQGTIIRNIQRESTVEIQNLLKKPVNLRLIVKVRSSDVDSQILFNPQ
jgi:GTP-binding protein Era